MNQVQNGRAIVDLPKEDAAQFLKQIAADSGVDATVFLSDVNGNEDEHVRFRHFVRWNCIEYAAESFTAEEILTKVSWLRGTGIERKVQLQNIHSGVAKNPEITSIGVLLNEFANFVFAQSPSFRDARDLQLRITQADFWIESAA